MNNFCNLNLKATYKYFLGITFFLFLNSNLFAQTHLYFINRIKNKIIEVKPGQMLSIKYKGYLGQTEFAKASVTEITDSMIALGIDPEVFGTWIAGKLNNNPGYVYRKIYIRDILTFRRITPARSMLKTAFVAASVVGTYFILYDYYLKNNFSTTQTFFISLGVAIGSSVIVDILLPEKPKYKMEDGWEAFTGTVKPKL